MLALKTELAKIAAQAQKSAEEQIKTADRLRSKGFVLGSDYYAAQAALSSIKTARTMFENDILAQSAALAVRLGRNPENILKQGYTFTANAKGEMIRSRSQVQAGDVIITHFSDGQITSEVQ